MILFHALQICTIAYISNTVQGHVLLAVNVEDFRNLANQFLSKSLAEKLTQLVSESAVTQRRGDKRTGDKIPDIDLNKVAEIIREKIVHQYQATPEHSTTKVTREHKIKRFNTIRNSDDVAKRQTITVDILRDQNDDKTTSGPIYVKDDLETLLQANNNGQSNDNSRQFVYAGIRQDKSTDKTPSLEPADYKGSFDVARDKRLENSGDTPKNIDYTETKLGEWIYNHKISQKPEKIKNHKFANTDVNDEGNSDELPNESESVKTVQYVYQTHLSGPNDKSKKKVRDVAEQWRKNKDTENINTQDQEIDDNSKINEYIMRPKINTKKKPQTELRKETYPSSKTKEEIDKYHLMDTHEDIDSIRGNENTFNRENIALTPGKVRIPESLEETKTEPINAEMESFLNDEVEAKHRPIEEHITFNKYILGSKDTENNPKESVREKDIFEGFKLSQKTKNNEVHSKKGLDLDEKRIMESKKIFSDENIPLNKEVNQASNRDQFLITNKKGDPNKKFSKNHHYLSDYEEAKLEPIKSKLESSLDVTVEGKDQREENYTQRKKTQRQPIEENDMYDKYTLDSDTKNHKQRKHKSPEDEEYEFKKPIAGKHRFVHDVSKEGGGDFINKGKSTLRNTKRDSSVRVSKYAVFTTNTPMKDKKLDEDLLPDFQTAKVVSRFSEESNNRQVDKHALNKYNFGKGTYKKKPMKQPIEDNDMYEKYSLDSKDRNSERREVKKNDYKYGYAETVVGKKHKDHRGYDREGKNYMYDQHALDYKDKNSERGEVKKKDNKYGNIETVGKKNNDQLGFNRDEKKSMYDQHAMGSKDKSSERGEVKKKDNKYGYIETVGKKNNDHRGFDRHEKNDMYDQHAMGSKDKNSEGREVMKNENKHRYTEKAGKKNNDHRGFDRDEKNYMYDQHAMGSKDKNSKSREVKKDDDYEYNKAVSGKKKKGNHRGLNNDDSGNNDELPLKNKNSHMKITKKLKEPQNEEVPSAGYADDPRPDFKEVKPESIKAKTESLLESVENKQKPTKRFTMKGTVIPKREFYKLSSPNYYKKLPRIVDKYNFDEPIPELDRERDKVAYLKREPARVNRKHKLPVFDKF